MSDTSSTYIVTGGAGFIGSHLIEELIARDFHVIVVDNLTTGCRDNLPKHEKLRILVKDILDCHPEDFQQENQPPIAGIAHLAATSSVQASWLKLLAAHHNNLSTTVAVIQLCQQLTIPRLVLASSAAVYSNQIELPIHEEAPKAPIAPYGLQKLVSEQHGALYSTEYAFSTVALRIFNAYGPRQQTTSPYSGIISIFTERMKQGLSITIYGDGQQTRDFVYVKNVAYTFAQALTHPLSPGSFLACNLGTQTRTSLLRLIDVLQECIPNWRRDIRFVEARMADIKDSEADISYASAKLAFQPKWTIQQGLSQLVKSLQSV